MNKQINKRKKGFTLAELMAVVVIISILAGIALGAYRSSLERARFSDGLAGAHALAAAVDTYYYDHIAEPTNLNNIAVSLARSSASGNDITTATFTYTYDGANKRVVATRINGNYQIRAYSERASGGAVDECVGTDSGTDGKEFCESLGYKNCTGTVCTKAY